MTCHLATTGHLLLFVGIAAAKLLLLALDHPRIPAVTPRVPDARCAAFPECCKLSTNRRISSKARREWRSKDCELQDGLNNGYCPFRVSALHVGLNGLKHVIDARLFYLQKSALSASGASLVSLTQKGPGRLNERSDVVRRQLHH